MTRERLDEFLLPGGGRAEFANGHNTVVVTRDACDDARRVVHSARAKMLFRQRYEHRTTAATTMPPSSKGGVLEALDASRPTYDTVPVPGSAFWDSSASATTTATAAVQKPPRRPRSRSWGPPSSSS